MLAETRFGRFSWLTSKCTATSRTAARIAISSLCPSIYRALLQVSSLTPRCWVGSDRVLPIVDRLQRRCARRAKSPNIPHRWLAEEAAVFAVELAGAFVSDLKGRTCGVQTIHEHAAPRCLQPKLFLILKRTHGGQHPEMMVQRGHAHARDFCEIFHP